MAEASGSDESDGSDISELGEVSNVLLLAPSLGGRGNDVCLDLLTQSPPDETNVLGVTYTESPGEFVSRWSDGVGEPPASGGIVTVGETDASVRSANWTVRGVGNPADLTGIGIELSELLSNMATAAGNDESVAVCFNNLTSLLQYADLQRVFRFLHVVTGRVKTIGGIGHYHIDPEAHDKQTMATLKGLFDAVIEVSEDGILDIQQ